MGMNGFILIDINRKISKIFRKPISRTFTLQDCCARNVAMQCGLRRLPFSLFPRSALALSTALKARSSAGSHT